VPNQITEHQKEAAIEAIRRFGTNKAGAKAAGVDVKTLNNEMRRSAMFKRRLLEAREEGRQALGDNAIQIITDYAEGRIPKKESDRNQLTAALALANWVVPGFRGSTNIVGDFNLRGQIKVVGGPPRPRLETKATVIEDKPKLLK